MPFAGYEDFAACVADNANRENPEAFCAWLEQQTGETSMRSESVSMVEDGRWKRVGMSLDGQPLYVVDTAATIKVEVSPVEVEVEVGDEYVEPMADEPVEPMMNEPVEPMDEAVPDMPDGIETAAVDFRTLIMVEGQQTGDGRVYEQIGWREPPLPFMALDTTTDGHMDARLVGNYTRFWKQGAEVWGEGVFVQSDDPDVVRLQRLIRQGELVGVSADMDDLTVELVVPQAAMDEPMTDENGDLVMRDVQPLVRVTEARLMGATAVPFPAFALGRQIEPLVASGYGDMDFQPPEGAREEAERGLEWRREYGRGGTEVGVARARDISNGANLSPDTVRRMVSYFARHAVDEQGEGWRPGEDGFPSAGRIAWALWGGDPGRTWAESMAERMDIRDREGSIVASAPVAPPVDWFTNPGLMAATPLTVTDQGRVFGHLALWDSCHVGFTDRCVTPPRTTQNYATFHSGEVVCLGGERVRIGQITMDTGHANLNHNSQRAVEHYDHTGWAVADVTVGEDAFGIWIAGTVRPDVDELRLRRFRAAAVSGDWRRIGSGLELVGILSVNVPGFPTAKYRREDGLVAALVASLPVCDQRNAIKERIAASIGRSRKQRIAELAARIRKGS